MYRSLIATCALISAYATAAGMETQQSPTESIHNNSLEFLGGFQSLKGKDSADVAMSGYSVGLRVRSVFEQAWYLKPFVRLGMSYFSVGNTLRYRPIPGLVQDVLNDLSAALWSVDSGVQYELEPQILLVSAVGFSSELTGEQQLTDKHLSFVEKTERKVNTMRFANLALSANYQFFPGFRAGLEGSYHFGGELAVEGNPTHKLSGYNFSLVSDFDFDLLGH